MFAVGEVTEFAFAKARAVPLEVEPVLGQVCAGNDLVLSRHRAVEHGAQRRE
jgi:hypothetical protein